MRSMFFGVLVLAACVVLPYSALYADEKEEQRARLQEQLDQINRDIEQNKSELSEKQKLRTSLERDVAILDAKIEAAQLAIKKRNLVIQGLKSGILDKEVGIRALDDKVSEGEASLAQILRSTRQLDDLSIAEIALGSSLSAVFAEVDRYRVVQESLAEAFATMATQRSDLAARKKALEDQQQEEQELLQIQVLQQQDLKKTEREKQDLVTAARGQESVYQQVIAGKQRTAAQIEAALFALRDSAAVTFGDMYGFAKEASGKTGVPPAFILAVLKQESDLGNNIGSCYMTNLDTGDGVGKNSGEVFQKVMKVPRDTVPFLEITQAFGLNWSSTPVSCPLGKKYTSSRGYGGAMGPAQFIPSTWKLYEDRIGAAIGQQKPNPWDARTATFATAIYVEDLGAGAGTRTAMRTAALKYFAGSHWKNPNYGFYGDQVLEKMDELQSQIAILGG